ncbi:MAG TPA: hypothetical protein VGI61_11910 [Parafilimonas sp.]
MLKIYFFFFIIVISMQPVFSQHSPINRKQFFLSDSVINVQLTTDIRKLRNDKSKPVWLPARIVMNFADTLVIDETIHVEPRGVYRKDNCDLASLMLDFNTGTAPLLSKLKKLKLVGGCRNNESSEELLLREYLVYKIYNILSPMSFHVRLLHVTYNDSSKRMKPYTQYAFLLEDVKDVAERNNCTEKRNQTFGTEGCNRQQITFVNIFEYMIGNTDYAVTNRHNIKLVVPLTDTFAKPYPVPYDFDYSGVVNAPYAVPDQNIDITNVRERYYRGYERTLPELDTIAAAFKEKQASIIKYVNDFYLLKSGAIKDITSYLQQFFDILKSELSIRYAFITNAVNR